MATITASTQPASPPSSALPRLPMSKLRTPSSSSDASRLPTTLSLQTKSVLRQSSGIAKPQLSPSHRTLSSPDVSASTSSRKEAGKQDSEDIEALVRRTVSIANFPQPPKVRRSGQRSSADAQSPSQSPRAAASRSSSLRARKLKPKVSTGSLNQLYTATGTASLLDNSGESRSVSGAMAKRRSSGRASFQSQSHSPVSSVEDSRSTSATTFEDSDDRRQSESGTRDREPDSRESESKGNVIVSVRVRPDAGGDRSGGREWLVDSRQSLVAYKGRERGDYFYDNVFAPYDKNHKVYDASAKRLVRRVMEGYQGTVFAYGMTGTGKTFSMQGTRDSPGVIPLAITDIFSYIRETPSREFLLRVSYLEIYNEKIHDLLTPATLGGQQQEEIKLREDSKRGVFASPLKEEIVQSPTQLLRVIARGDQCRKTRSTQFNAQSSRSHAVVQIVVESRERASFGKATDKRSALLPGGVRVSTLSMIDLAGSERAADSKERQKEGAHINKSLLTLGTVVSKLSGNKEASGNPSDKDNKHLPYRDSKLTRLLQPALSGNALISILCTVQIGSAGSVATAGGHTVETLNTLKFAARARNNIVSHAKKAEEALGTAGDGGSRVLLERYRMEIQDLRSQLETQKKEQAQKEDLEERDEGLGMESDQRRQEQITEIHLAKNMLQRRMEDLKRLIISSQSSGVNANSKVTSAVVQSALPSSDKGDASVKSIRSLRSSASQSSLGRMTPPISRNLSLASTITAGRQADEMQGSPISSLENEDEDDLGDGTASPHNQIRALQIDLADKNRYIATLEKRLLQARRSSQSRASLLLSPTTRHNIAMLEETGPSQALKDKDAEIADLRARLDDKDRMVSALRSAARNRDTADPSFTPTSPPVIRTPKLPSKESSGSSGRMKDSDDQHHVSNESANNNDSALLINESGLVIDNPSSDPHVSNAEFL